MPLQICGKIITCGMITTMAVFLLLLGGTELFSILVESTVASNATIGIFATGWAICMAGVIVLHLRELCRGREGGAATPHDNIPLARVADEAV